MEAALAARMGAGEGRLPLSRWATSGKKPSLKFPLNPLSRPGFCFRPKTRARPPRKPMLLVPWIGVQSVKASGSMPWGLQS